MCCEHKAKPKEKTSAKNHKNNENVTKYTTKVIKCNIVETWDYKITESEQNLNTKKIFRK